MSKSLFDLIKTLSKAEKRVFSENIKSTKRMPYYKKLISVYSKSDAYSEQLDKKIFKSETIKFVCDSKSKCKQLMYDYLLTLEKNKGLYHQVEHRLKIALMLKNRRQFDEAQKILEKIEPIATTNEFCELLYKIKQVKILVLIEIGKINKGLDIKYINHLQTDLDKSILRLIELQRAKSEYQLSNLTCGVSQGFFKEKEVQSKKLPAKDEFKNLRFQLYKLQTNYNKHIPEDDLLSAFKVLEQLMELTEKNEKVLLKADMLGNAYPFYIGVYIEYCIVLNKEIDVEYYLKKFDKITCHTIHDKFRLIRSKTDIYCIYALSINQPALAISQIAECEEFVEKHNLSLIYDSIVSMLLVYFALGKWDKCLEIVSKIESSKPSSWIITNVTIIKPMCLYERGDFYYFSSLIKQYRTKRKKKKNQSKESDQFVDYMLTMLYYLDKRSTNQLVSAFRPVLSGFDATSLELRYLIHWLVKQSSELNNDAYHAFLEQHRIKHFGFKSIDLSINRNKSAIRQAVKSTIPNSILP